MSLNQSGAFAFQQKLATFTTMGVETNFSFKVFKKFEAGFYVGMGITKRKSSTMVLGSFKYDFVTEKIIEYTPVTFFLKATELSFRYGVKFKYIASQKLYFVLQAGDNSSKFKKYSFGNTHYAKANLGVGINL